MYKLFDFTTKEIFKDKETCFLDIFVFRNICSLMKLFKSGHWIPTVFVTYSVGQIKDCALLLGLAEPTGLLNAVLG